MKRQVLFIFALLCAVAQGAWSENVVNLSTLTSDYVAQDGDVLTGITTTNYTNISNSDNAWYTLDGRKFSGKPTANGLYINNGKKGRDQITFFLYL